MLCRLAPCLLAACGGAAIATTTPAPAEPAGLTVSDAALGPLTPTTRANVIALRDALRGYDVQPVNAKNREIDAELEEPKVKRRVTLEYQVFDPHTNAKLFSIIPDDAGGIGSIEVTSGKVAVAGRTWRVGAKLADASALTACECRNEHPVCFQQAPRVGIAFERSCRGLRMRDPRSRQRLEGLAIAWIVWTPNPSAVEHAHDGPSDDEPVEDPFGP